MLDQLEDGEGALGVGGGAVALVLAVDAGADVLVQALGRLQAGVKARKKEYAELN